MQPILNGVSEAARITLSPLIERPERLHQQGPKDKSKLYAFMPPMSSALTKAKLLSPMSSTSRLDWRSPPGPPCEGNSLQEWLDQVEWLKRVKPTTAIVDLGFRGRAIEGATILHRDKAKSLTNRPFCARHDKHSDPVQDFSLTAGATANQKKFCPRMDGQGGRPILGP